MPLCSVFCAYHQLSGGSHGNIEEEQRADVGVCSIKSEQTVVQPKVNTCPAQRCCLGLDTSAQQSQG